MFQIFVDSAANLPAVTAKQYDINVISFVNLVDGKEITCFDPDLSPEEERQKGTEYYQAMSRGCEIKTGLISTAAFEEAFRSALEADQDVLYFSLSKNISGTYNSARLASEELLDEFGDKHKIRLVDSLNASLAQGILAVYASEMRTKGMSVDDAHFYVFLRLNRLMQPVRITSSRHDTSCKFIDDHNLSFCIHNIVLIFKHQIMRAQSKDNIMLDLQIFRIGKIFNME